MAALLPLMLAGCTSLGGIGPSAGKVLKSGDQAVLSSQVKVVDVDSATVTRQVEANRPALFSDRLGNVAPTSTVVGRGDVLEITVVEAPPAVLYSSGATETALRNPLGATNIQGVTSARGWSSPQQVVDLDGKIFVPFAGSIPAAGRTPRDIERDIVARLAGKAHDPQVMVRRIANAAANVTVLGDVGQNGRYPLSAHGERLLEIIAAAGGPKQALSKSVVQIERNQQTYVLPLSLVSRDPAQNVTLLPNDVVTVLFQPYSFTSLGASGSNSEIMFEGPGFTLAQALGRMGGLQDTRSNVKGVFIFRLENPSALDPATVAGTPLTADGKIPIVYRINLSDPKTLFNAQQFPIKNRDVVYISNAPLVDFNKFLGIISSTIFSVVGVVNSVP